MERNWRCKWLYVNACSYSVDVWEHHLSRLSLCASILQSFPRVCGTSRLLHSLLLTLTGILNALGPVRTVILLPGSIRDVSMPWTSCRKHTLHVFFYLNYVSALYVHNHTLTPFIIFPINQKWSEIKMSRSGMYSKVTWLWNRPRPRLVTIFALLA